MTGRRRLSASAVLAIAAIAGSASAQDSRVERYLGERAARDAARVASAQRQYGAGEAANSTRRRLAELVQQRDALLARAEALDADIAQATNEALALGDEATYVIALAQAAGAAQEARLRSGPLGIAAPELLATKIADPGAGPLALAALASRLASELQAASRLTRATTSVLGPDGVPARREVLAIGAVLLAADGRRLEVDPLAGPRLPWEDGAPDAVAPGRPPPGFERLRTRSLAQRAGEFGKARFAASGWTGWLILALAALGAALILGAAAGRQTHPAATRVLARTALLLGLLGTIVGLIRVFQALAESGANLTQTAADGIGQALGSTWLGLLVAIVLTLAGLWLSDRRATPVSVTAAPPARGAVLARGRGLRRLLGAAAGVLIPLTLFAFMTALLSGPADEAPPPVAAPPTIRALAPPPPPPEPRPRSAMAVDPSGVGAPQLPAIASEALALADPSLPPPGSALTLGGEGSGGPLAGATTGDWLPGGASSDFEGAALVPISSARPRYPQLAARQQLEGWVELIFTISAGGKVGNIRVLDAEPPGVFENAAAQAMANWLYAPLYRNGRAVAREATQLFRFSKADIDPEQLRDAQ